MQDRTVPVEDLRAAGFGDEVEKVATAVAGYLDDGTGDNVAVVSDPYAGRDALLEYAESLLDGEAVRVNLDPSAADGNGPPLPETDDEGSPATAATDSAGSTTATAPGADHRSGDDNSAAAGADSRSQDDPETEDDGPAAGGAGAGALVVGDCHYLFERGIDGFGALDAFLDRIALSEALVVTSWNRYAWSYLDVVRDVGDTFTTVVEIPPLDAGEIETVVEAHHGPALPEVVDAGGAGRVKTVVFDSRSVGVAGRSIAVPYPKPNPAWTASWSISDADESVRAVTFEKLRRVSNGNPGVALAVWEESVTDGEVAPGYIEAFETDLRIDDDAAVLLWTVLAQESVDVDRLTRLFAGRPVEASLQGLAERGLVTVAAGRVSVTPQALYLVVAALDRWGLLW